MLNNESNNFANYLFEISWEVCNKVGGIYTVITTKAPQCKEKLKDHYILIGPDVWKETMENPYFEEDRYLYKNWKEKALSEGFKIRIGRFKDAANSVAILIDFTTYFEKRDDILYQLWNDYHVDSLSAGWDYIEPALFGYAAGRLIEHFYKYNITENDSIKAHFHEWMTGAGILYLKKNVPQVATLFTTHATVLGRSMAGNSWPIQNQLENYDPEIAAKQLCVLHKHSLEKASAQNADVFTTVSHTTGNECKFLLNREVDEITPNGFDKNMVPDESTRNEISSSSKQRLIEVAEVLINKKFGLNTKIITTSGRYEFHNKGIDMFIDALGKLNESGKLTENILVYIFVPANHSGPRTEIIDQIGNNINGEPILLDYCTHKLVNADNDQIIKRFKDNKLFNAANDKVNVIFVPAYLDGKDGVINLHYYSALQGCDFSVYPSIYEPWGYTPLESIAYGIPTITSSAAGFGQWLKNEVNEYDKAVYILDRKEDNYAEAAIKLFETILEFTELNITDLKERKKSAIEISKRFYWNDLFKYYIEAYKKSDLPVKNRYNMFKGKQIIDEHSISETISKQKSPEWRKFYVKSEIPEQYKDLERLSQNLWWVWNYQAYELWEMFGLDIWEENGHNPVKMLENLSKQKWEDLIDNKIFSEKYLSVIEQFDKYMAEKLTEPDKMVAYFSMEYGLHDSIKIFSGGLGILAGDYLKQASDSNANMIGIGLLYRYGYFKQSISPNGEQSAQYIPQKFTHMPLIPVKDKTGEWVKITIALPGRSLTAKAWLVNVGRIPLYLLDTDIEENSPEDRKVTHQLYGGDWDNRFKQELLIGVGGIRLIKELGLNPSIYHCNEGHAAFIGLERLKNYIQDDGLSFQDAIEVVRASSLFTTHTPVPAGHDAFDETTIRTYLSHYPDRLRISWNKFMNLGRSIENDSNQKFSMSVLALKLSQLVNGVSKIHGMVSQEMFASMFPGYYPKELFIGYVTNGVHYFTWAARSWQKLYLKYFGKDFLKDQSNPNYWEKIYTVSDKEIWDIKKKQKSQLFEFLTTKIEKEMGDRNENPKLIMETIESFKNNNNLIVGFARRFATYKRAHLLFTDLQRLEKIVTHPTRPITFIFAGKAHPNDKAGQGLIKRIIEISRMPQFIGKILFIENYNMTLAKYLIRGVDVWMNTPTRPLEASGTSGEKAIMNGTLNISVLDGWWAEGYVKNAGWALKEEQTYADNSMQDQLDAQIIYSLFEDEISKLYYDRNEEGISKNWIEYIKNCIAKINPKFTMKRQLDDYYNKFYNKMFDRSAKLNKNNYAIAKNLAAWKSKMKQSWNGIEALSVSTANFENDSISINDSFKAEVVVRINELSPENIGLEVLFCKKERDIINDYEFKYEMELTDSTDNTATFKCDIPLQRAGVFNFVFRAYPKNDLLPHRQDFPLISWL